jgi:hypothetical protein
MAIVYGANYGRPTLDLNFAKNKSLIDTVSGLNLVNFSRSQTAREATYVGSDGLIKTAVANEPRFDHNPLTGECLGLLVEEARTNLITRSDNFSISPWAISPGGSVSLPTGFLSPSGELTATKIIPNSGITNGRLQYNNATAGTYTFTIYAKADGFNFLGGMVQTSGSGFPKFCFDLTTGQFQSQFTVQGSATLTSNNWWRLRIYTPVHNANGAILLAPRHNFDPINYDGVAGADGVKGVQVWGAQLEVGSFPTSYIPTTGSTVTRSADVASITGTNFSRWYNSNQSSLFVDMTINDASYAYSAMWGFGNNNSRIEGYPGVTTPFNGLIFFYDGVTQKYIGTASQSWSAGTRTKCAYSWNFSTGEGSVSLRNNSTLTSTGVPSVPSPGAFYFYGRMGGTQSNTGTISRLTYWPSRLQDFQLQQLTK